MKNVIKSKDLCDRCKFTYEPYCNAMNGGKCNDCENLSEDGMCLCTTIRKNTPCPYFREILHRDNS